MTSSFHSDISAAGVPSVGPASATSKSQAGASQILIASNVQRLVNRIPYNSGMRLFVIEEEELLRRCVANLVSLSRFQLGGVLRELLSVLENLPKTASNSLSEDKSVIDILQSQLFVLKVMVACVLYQWKSCSVETERLPPHFRERDEQAETGSSIQWLDPPALDDNLAKHLLTSMTAILRQAALREEAAQNPAVTAENGSDSRPIRSESSTSSFASRVNPLDRMSSVRDGGASSSRGFAAKQREDSDGITDWNGQGDDRGGGLITTSTMSLGNEQNFFHLCPSFPASRTPFDLEQGDGNPGTGQPPRFAPEWWRASTSSNRDESAYDNAHSLSISLYRHASQIVFYLSTSNWPVILARLRNRLGYLSATAEDNPSTADLRILECSNLQRGKLSAVIQEITGTFLHLKRSAQQTLALVLRRAIWAWIQYHPEEFGQLVASGRRLEGGADVLFDHVNNIAESTRKKVAFWPVMTALLILCPEAVSSAAIGDNRKGGSSVGKKIAFVEALRKGLRNQKLQDASILCCVDICKAATFTTKHDVGLRLLVPDIEGELKERLFDPSRPALAATKQIDIPIMVELFVALYTVDPNRIIREIVPTCMAESSPLAFRIALVKACGQLASERETSPSSPRLDLLYPHISAALRGSYRELSIQLHRAGKPVPRLPERRGLGRLPTSNRLGAADDQGGKVELIEAILQLWTADLGSLCHGLDLKEDLTRSAFDNAIARQLFDTGSPPDSIMSTAYAIIFFGLASSTWSLCELANNVVANIFAYPDNEPSIDAIRAFRRMMMYCTPRFSRAVMDQIISTENSALLRHLMQLLQTIWKHMNQYVKDLLLIDNPNRPDPEEILSNHQLAEIMVLITMCSADTDVCAAARQCCLREFTLRTFWFQNSSKLPGTAQWYEEWSKFNKDLAESNFSLTGRIAQQKRIRTLLRAIRIPSCAGVTAWKEAYTRWKVLTQVVARPLMEHSGDSAQEKAAQWHNYAGFLAAFGGACAVERIDLLPEPLMPGYLNPRFLDDTPPIPLMESFVSEMVDLLVSDSIWVREKVKETLGGDLSPRLNGILFRQVHAVLSDFFDKTNGLPCPADMFTVFVEQSISVVQMVVKRMEENSDVTATVDIGALMVLYVEYVNSIGRKEQSLRIKTAMCSLCEALMTKRQCFSFPHELRVRNRLFQALVSWISDASEEEPASEKLDRLQHDLDVACLKTVSILLDKLPLLLADDALRLDDKVEWAKSRQFAFYFSFFIKILNRAGGHESKGTDGKAPVSRSKESNGRELGSLKASAIMALSNLLASNVESGLQHSLHLAYQDDPQIRAAFMQIMTNVLNQGTAFNDLERLTASQKQSRLVELISEPDMQLALSIAQVCRGSEAESLDAILLNTFDSRGGIMRFLKSAMLEEILSTPSEEMVFRSNSFRTHLLSVFVRTHGYEFLRSIIGPLVMEMASKPRGYSFEIDPSKIEPGDSVHINQIRLEEMAQAFIDQIRSSAPRVPAVIRELCRHIKQIMDARFPNATYQGRGGFIFLRIISPAIVAPQTIDVQIPGAGRDIRRGLLLISKIIQTLVTHSLFPPHKEPFMTSLNDFLKRNIRNVTEFLDAISDARTDPDRLLAADLPLGYGINPYGYGLHSEDERELHRFLLKNVDKIGKELVSRGPEHVSNVASNPGDVKRVYDQLCDALSTMGEVKNEDGQLAAFAGSQEENRIAYNALLQRSNGRPIADSYRSIFYEGSFSKAGRSVFYYCAARHNAETADFEGFIIHILRTMESGLHRPYDLLLDLTGTSPENLWPTQWLLHFGSLLPAELMLNIKSIIIVNMNTPCRLYLRPLLTLLRKASGTRLFDFGSNRPTVGFCASVPEIETFIERRNFALDPSTLAILTAPIEQRFTSITMVWYYRSMTPVSFRIGGDHLQITALREQEVMPGRSAYLNDVFHLADIDDVRAVAIRGDESTFFFSARGGTISFLFNSRDRSEVVQALRQAKAKVSHFRGAKAIERTLLPSDVPGTILNMAMLNITSDNYQLRLSAYDLLCALSTSFNFASSNARKKLLSVKGLALPPNMLIFVSDLSRDFAEASPRVTLEFLLSFFEGYQRATKSQKTMCLHYMAPWLANLTTFAHSTREQQGEHQKRIREILMHLINITRKEPDMYAVMQKVVWFQLSKLDELIPLFLELFSEAAMDSGIHTEQFEAIVGSMVAFSSINLRGKLLARLRRVVAKTAHSAQAGSTALLHEHVAWKEIETLVRMNMMLSFTNRLEVMLYLPEFLHIILLLAGNGVDATRSAIYGTAINVMHSLCTEDPRERESKKSPDFGSPEGVGKLRALLQSFAEEDVTKLFGLPRGEVNAFNASSSVIRESPDNSAIEKLALLMYNITEIAAPCMDTANSWRARLTSLVTSTAFQYNPIIQSRAFVLLGCLAQGEIDDDLLYQILVSLRGSLTEWANNGNDAPIISIVACLSKIVSILPPRSRYLPQMFWLGVAVIQYGHVSLFKVGVDLLRTAVATIWERKLHLEEGQTDLITFLLDARFDFRDAAIRMDDESGVDFDINFSFAMAALLVRGLRHPSTKEGTVDLLQMLLRFTATDHAGEGRSAAGRISEAQLGFFVGLLPTAVQPEAFGELLTMAGVDPSLAKTAVEQRQKDSGGVFNCLDAYDNKIALLVVTLAASLLQHAESDQEKVLLYCFLADSARVAPAIVSILYDSLVGGMREVTINSQVAPILDAVNAIAQVAVSEPIFSAQAKETSLRGGPSAYLEESGYAGLLDCGNFVPLGDYKRLQLSRLLTSLLIGLIDAGTA